MGKFYMNNEKRMNYLIKEHKRVHHLIEYMEADSISAESKITAKKRKLAIKDELQRLYRYDEHSGGIEDFGRYELRDSKS